MGAISNLSISVSQFYVEHLRIQKCLQFTVDSLSCTEIG